MEAKPMTFKTRASLAVLAMALGCAPLAMAQTPPAQRPSSGAPTTTEAPKTPVPGQILQQDANTVLAKDLIGQAVYQSDDTKIGNISDLILSKDGRTVQGFVIGVGGFLGIGEKSVALNMDRLNMSQGGDGAMKLTMDIKKDELANAPTFKSKRDLDSEKQAAERARSQPTPSPGGATRPGMN
jgi:sporulation protein YlmC with PRC-barrel domain